MRGPAFSGLRGRYLSQMTAELNIKRSKFRTWMVEKGRVEKWEEERWSSEGDGDQDFRIFLRTY